MKTKTFTLETNRQGYYDITHTVHRVVAESGVKSGLAVVFCPHTTGAITINENADPDVKHDLTLGFDSAFPDRPAFLHAEGRSEEHTSELQSLGRAPQVLDRRRKRNRYHRGRKAAPRHMAGHLFLRVRRPTHEKILRQGHGR